MLNNDKQDSHHNMYKIRVSWEKYVGLLNYKTSKHIRA